MCKLLSVCMHVKFMNLKEKRGGGSFPLHRFVYILEEASTTPARRRCLSHFQNGRKCDLMMVPPSYACIKVEVGVTSQRN